MKPLKPTNGFEVTLFISGVALMSISSIFHEPPIVIMGTVVLVVWLFCTLMRISHLLIGIRQTQLEDRAVMNALSEQLRL